MSTKKTVLIIGGGPAGLTAAYEFLRQTDVIPLVVEQSEHLGGISRTEQIEGNRIDIGGHRFFSKSDRVMEWWQDFMPVQSDQDQVQISYHNKKRKIDTTRTADNPDNVMLIRKRKSRIYHNKQFFNYPISLSFDTLKKLGLLNTFHIGRSYLYSAAFPVRNVETLEDFFINRFGKRLYQTFFKDYTEKVWGVPCTKITAEWGAQRIKGLSVTKTLLDAAKKMVASKSKKVDINQKKTETSLIEYFLYPKYGPGQMWELVAERIEELGGMVLKQRKAVKLCGDGRSIQSVGVENILTGVVEDIKVDYVLSSMPIKHLVKAFTHKVPKKVEKVATGLNYRDFITVGLLLDELIFDLDDTWIYIQESYVKVGRLQVFNNWSPHMVADAGKTWIGLEYFCTVGDDIWNLKDEELVQLALKELKILEFVKQDAVQRLSKVIRAPKAYPGYFGTYSEFSVVREYLDGFENLFLAGRNGLHKYNNQDHSMLTAMKVVELIKKGETDKSPVWEINTEENYNEEK